MPKMSGWELFERIKNNPKWKDIPVIFLTAFTDDDKRFDSASADDFIGKPYDVDDLKSKVYKFLK
jgi:CheY-like chemotaxis protein